MDKVELGGDYWIKGRSTSLDITRLQIIHSLNGDEIIYTGKTDEISEELAATLVDWNEFDEYHKVYVNYSGSDWKYYAVDSIKTACDSEYCIIYKKIN